MGLGSLRDVGLSRARGLRDEARRRLVDGSDPLADRKSPSTAMPIVEIEAPPTLWDVWTEYVAGQKPAWRGRKTAAGWTRSIEKHADLIKDKPVADIDLEDVLAVLQPLWMIKAESAGKLRERLERVLDYAKVKKLRSGENPARWKGNLIHLLPPRPKLQRGHMPALPYQQLPALMHKLAASQGMSARALEFTILTAARESMTLEARWSEVEDDLWSLDDNRMKKGAFRQPLSTGALRVLDKVRPTSPAGEQLIFPGLAGKALSDMAMDMMLRDLAPGCTPHGMRSTFRDWAGDETDFARETIEECLAHSVGDETERAYRRSDALKKRKAVLDAWSDFCLRSN